MADTNSKNTSSPDTNRNPKTGRWVKGCKAGPGNPNNKRTHDYRKAIRDSVSEADLKRIMGTLTDKAVRGDTIAAKEVLDRVVGKAVQTIDANVTHSEISPDEAAARIAEFFGVKL